MLYPPAPATVKLNLGLIFEQTTARRQYMGIRKSNALKNRS